MTAMGMMYTMTSLDFSTMRLRSRYFSSSSRCWEILSFILRSQPNSLSMRTTPRTKYDKVNSQPSQKLSDRRTFGYGLHASISSLEPLFVKLLYEPRRQAGKG